MAEKAHTKERPATWGTVRVAAILKCWSIRAEHPSLGVAKLDGGRTGVHSEQAGLWISADRLAGASLQSKRLLPSKGRISQGRAAHNVARKVVEGWVHSAALGRCNLVLSKPKATSGLTVLEGNANLGRAILHTYSLRWPKTSFEGEDGGVSRAASKGGSGAFQPFSATKATHAVADNAPPFYDVPPGSAARRRRGWVAGVRELSCELRSDVGRLLEVFVERVAASVHQNRAARSCSSSAPGDDILRDQGDVRVVTDTDCDGISAGTRCGVVRYRHVVLRISGDTAPTLARIARRAAALFQQSASGSGWPASSGRCAEAERAGPLGIQRGSQPSMRRIGRRGGGSRGVWWPGGAESDSSSDSDESTEEEASNMQEDTEESGDRERLRGVLFSSRSPRHHGRGRRGRRARWDADSEEDCEHDGVPAGELLVEGEVCC